MSRASSAGANKRKIATAPKADAAAAAAVAAAAGEAGKAAAASSLLGWAKFVIGVAGIFFFYGTLYANAQRELTSEQAPVAPETRPTRFTNTAFVLLVQCTGNALFSIAMHFVTVYVFGVCTPQEEAARGAKHGGAPKAITPFFTVLLSLDAVKVSFGYVFAMYSSNKALEFVSYPLQILAKSCKMIPVMLGSILILRKSYGPLKYLSVAIMTAGVVYFSFLEKSGGHKKEAKADAAGSAAVYGYGLLVASLVLDGLSGPMQEGMKKYVLTAFQQNLISNAWAIVYMGAVVLINNEWTSSVRRAASRARGGGCGALCRSLN